MSFAILCYAMFAFASVEPYPKWASVSANVNGIFFLSLNRTTGYRWPTTTTATTIKYGF